MEYIYEDLLDSNFIKPPFLSIIIDTDTDIDQKILDHNVLIFSNLVCALKLCLLKDISFTSNKLCVVLINQLNFENSFSKRSNCLSDFFEENHGFDPLKTTISFYFIPLKEKISYEIMFLSR